MFGMGFDLGLPFSQDISAGFGSMNLGTRRPLYAPQSGEANPQPAAVSGGGHVPLFARRSQPSDPPIAHAAAAPAAQPLQTNRHDLSTTKTTIAAPVPSAPPAPAKGPAMLLKLLSSGSGSLGASPLSGIHSNPTYTQVRTLSSVNPPTSCQLTLSSASDVVA